MELLTTLFPGIGTMLAQEPAIAIARIVLIVAGFILAYMGFTRKLEPLIMVPMGLGMICVNAGVLFLSDGSIGTLLLDPLVSDPTELMNILQVNCFQPIYNFMFSNGLIACLVFMGIGAQSEISFLLAKPWTSITIALFAELGTFVTLAVGMGFGRRRPHGAVHLPDPGPGAVRPHLHHRVPISEPYLRRLPLPDPPAGAQEVPRH